MPSFEQEIYRLIEANRHYIQTRPLNLGGVSSTYGGSGGPPGGFVGYLPQTRVAFDTSESESNIIPASGYSLLTNLDRIRYRIRQLELGTVGVSGIQGIGVRENNVTKVDPATILDFIGDVTITNPAPGIARISISTSGTSTGHTIQYSGVSQTSRTNLNFIGNVIVEDNSGGNSTDVTILDSESSLNWFNVKDYGATGNGTTDDTSAINSAISAIPSGGGVLYFPAGTYLTSGGFSLTKPISVIGDGNSSSYDSLVALTTIRCSSQTASLFTVSSEGCSFSKFLAINTYVGTQTSGAGITIESGGDFISYKNLTIRSFYINLDIQDGTAWMIDSCYFISPVLYGLKVQHSDFPDGGDQSISNCFFWPDDRDSDAAIRIESGGGMKIVNTKIVGSGQSLKYFDYGIDLSVGSNTETIILLVSNTSIEDCSINGIRCTTSASKPSNWDKIILSNVQIAFWNTVGESGIVISPDESGEMDQVIIDNCILSAVDAGNTSPAIALENVNKARIGMFIRVGFGSDAYTSNCTDVVFSGGDVSGPSVSTDGNVVLFDGTSGKLLKDGGFIPVGEILMEEGSSAPPIPLTNEAEDDWLYGG